MLIVNFKTRSFVEKSSKCIKIIIAASRKIFSAKKPQCFEDIILVLFLHEKNVPSVLYSPSSSIFCHSRTQSQKLYEMTAISDGMVLETHLKIKLDSSFDERLIDFILKCLPNFSL